MQITLSEFRRVIRKIIQEELQLNANSKSYKRIPNKPAKANVKTKNGGDKEYGSKDMSGNSQKNANFYKGKPAKGKEVNIQGPGAKVKRIENDTESKSKEMDMDGTPKNKKKNQRLVLVVSKNNCYTK